MMGIHDITSSFSNEFHKECPGAWLDIDDGILSPFPWHSINV
jgi:hypothetical protein